MSDKAVIKKVVLDLAGKEIQLTMEQAKKLHEALNEMFGSHTTYVYPTYWHWPTVWPVYPLTVDSGKPKYTCGDQSGLSQITWSNGVNATYNASESAMTLAVR